MTDANTPTTNLAPTADAYTAARVALERHRERADAAEAAIQRVRDLLARALAGPGQTAGGEWENPTPVPGWVSAVENELNGTYADGARR